MLVGDVNSTLACSITAKKLDIKVAHIEAGLRSWDMSMPEEINRIVTDSISDYFFVTEKNGIENLKREGRDEKQIFFVGHVMIDNLMYCLGRLNGASFGTTSLKDKLGQYLFLTLHRPSNVDNYGVFKRIIMGLNELAGEIPIIFPVHPRTRERLSRFGFELSGEIFLLDPLSFSESLYLWKDAKAVLTDSGGLQEETTALGVPCLTIRENTERPVTIETGTNTLVGSDMKKIKSEVLDILQGRYRNGQVPEKWDGKASNRIVDVLENIKKYHHE
jgi:UDP-N-acetylglucosamine 2-epimerase (non-hydrolysing)